MPILTQTSYGSGQLHSGNLTVVSQKGLTHPSPLLSDLPRLPSLANKCYLVGQAQRADMVWSRADFQAICEHMLNGNPLQHFLVAWTDARTGIAKFAKAPPRKRADKNASWAWDSIIGKAKIGTSVGFYPSNENQTTCWAAIDFDAHNGEHDRARRWSLAAFELLLKQPQLYLVLCTSGGSGFHLFIFTRELHPIREWIVLLKQVCEWIGAEVMPGACEIFPNDRAESQPVGKGIRAPGTVNPKTGQCSLIELETVKPLLDSLPRTWFPCIGKVNRNRLRNERELSLHKSTNTYSPSTQPLIEELIRKHAIGRTGTRNDVLMELIGDLAHKVGLQKARKITERHYRTYEANVRTPLDQHMKQFEAAWSGAVSKVRDRFSSVEKALHDKLRTEHQREAFRIVWAFAGAARYQNKPDFLIGRDSLADRLSISQAGASYVIQVLIDNDVIRPTRPYRPHVQSAHYRWTADLPRL